MVYAFLALAPLHELIVNITLPFFRAVTQKASPMPTIELVSVGCPRIPSLPTFPSFALIAETELVSHRGLFQDVFDSLEGVIVHLANKDCEPGSGWFAGQLMDWEYGRELLFREEVMRDVARLMSCLLDASPRRRIVFSTDYQFGGERQDCGESTLAEFWTRHDRFELRYNSLWHLCE